MRGGGRAACSFCRRERRRGTCAVISAGVPKRWNARAVINCVPASLSGVARGGGVVYSKVLGPKVESAYISSPLDEGWLGDVRTTR